MDAAHAIFGGTLLLVILLNSFMGVDEVSASIFDRIQESDAATAIRGVFGLPSHRLPNDQPHSPQQSTTPSTTTTVNTSRKPSSIIDRVVDHILPHTSAKPYVSSSTVKSQTTSPSTSATPTVHKSSTTQHTTDVDDEDTSTDEEGGSATVPPFIATCYLWKNNSGTITAVQMSRAEAGNDTYLDYEEHCTEEDVDTRISPGALASLVG